MIKLGVLILAAALIWYRDRRGWLLGALALLGLSSCTMTIDDQGRPVMGLDAVEAVRVIEMINDEK